MQKVLTICLFTAAALLATGCRPMIGDPCASALECPEGALCDTSIPEGYCIQYDCEQTGCPDNAFCIEFPTFSACMRHCQSDEECREEEGHICRDDLYPTSFCYLPSEAP